MDNFKKKYLLAEEQFNIVEMSNIMCQNIDDTIEFAEKCGVEPVFDIFWSKRAALPVWDMFMSFMQENYDRTLYLLQYIPIAIREKIGIEYYYGLCYYGLQQWEKAAIYFGEYLKKDIHLNNDLSWFFMGNSLCKLGYYDKATNLYKKALSIRRSFWEADYNMKLAFANKNVGFEMYPWKSYLNMNGISFKDIPIFINSRDRVEGLKKLIGWLWGNGYHNIYILDNDSTYPPLKEYYNYLECELNVKVVYLGVNLGHTAIWDSNILEELNIDTPYVYTDSDVVPEETCPADIIALFLDYLRYCPLLHKVGFGIKVDDITFKDADKIRNAHNSNMYNIPVAEGAYFSGIDTTFALYGCHRRYSITEAVRINIEGAQLLHLPWYYKDELPKDEQYYLEHANISSTFKRDTLKKY